MKYITLPEECERPLSFYLAMEEYVAHRLDERDCFFMWQVAPSVIYGRNQVIENEVDLDYCRTHGIGVFHRRSGGGCVYADQDNLMLSYVTTEENVGMAFNRYVNMLLLVFHRLGIEAVATRNNDIMVGERKVSGTACMKTGHRCIVHGTLLYDTNMEHMTHAITPTQAKLQKNGVQSVRQRIGLLKDYLTTDIHQLRKMIRTTLCIGERSLTEADVLAIEALARQYEVDL